METLFTIWLFLLSSSFHSSVAYPVFTYNGTAASKGDPSIAILVKEIELPNSFIFCTSVKQYRFDGVRFYSLTGRDSRHWMNMRFKTFPDATKVTLNLGDNYRILNTLRSPRLDFWYHICVRVDLTKNEIEIAVNGDPMGRVVEKNITNKPTKFRMEIGRDNFSNKQFQGSISNIHVLRGEGNVTELSALPCVKRENSLLQWNPVDWNVIGTDWSLEEEFEDVFCNISDNYNLAISSRISFKESVDICKHKLNNSISPWEDNPEWFQRYMAWHQNITEGACPFIWTPFSDEQSEGSFLNMNSFAKAEVNFWAKDEPNGGKYENYVIMSVAQAALYDVTAAFRSCSSCLISSSLLLKLDGRCQNSLIGTQSTKMFEFRAERNKLCTHRQWRNRRR